MNSNGLYVTTTEHTRKMWVDGLRGLVMLLVVFGHQAKGFTEFSVYTSGIKIPLFLL